MYSLKLIFNYCFTTWLTNTTFHNGGMHNVQHSQAMLEQGLCKIAHFFFHLKLKSMHMSFI